MKYKAGAVAAAIVFCVVFWQLLAAWDAVWPTRTTDTWSSELRTDAQKVGFLRSYVDTRSYVEAAEFHIRYTDKEVSGCSPRPASWDMEIVMRMAPGNVPRWTEGMEPLHDGDADLSWGYALLPDREGWTVASAPKLYRHPEQDMAIAVFEPEGILFMRSRSR